MAKFWVCNYCWEKGLEFATEVVFKCNQRADVVIKDWGIAVEILGSEVINSYLNKNYPIPAVPICAMTSAKKIYAMLEDMNATQGDGAKYYITKNIEDISASRRPKLISTMEELW